MSKYVYWTEDKVEKLKQLVTKKHVSTIHNDFDDHITTAAVRQACVRFNIKIPKEMYHYTNRKLTEKIVLKIRKDLEENKVLQIDIVKKYDLHPSTVSNIKLRKIWKHI